MTTRTGVVVALIDGVATIDVGDGETRELAVPDMIDVHVGTTVTIVDVGDDRPVVMWGS